MIAAISLTIILFITVLINRVATLALCHTGLSQELAKFQARSALTGSGFTTSESEKVLSHPVRRKIIWMLMLVGNAGIVTAVSSLILTFVIPKTTQSLLISFFILITGIALVWWVAKSTMVDRYLSRVIDRALRKYTTIDLRDYAAILHLSGDFQITDFKVDKQNWMQGDVLKDLKLSDEGILILGIQRANGVFLGTPDGDTQIMVGDFLTLYGKDSSIKALNEREQGSVGDKEHEKAVDKQEEVRDKEREKDMEIPLE